MIKKILVSLLFLAVILLGAMAITKTEPFLHFNAMRNSAMSIVHQELSRTPVPEEYASQVSTEALNKVNSFLQKHFWVKDCAFVTVGLLDYYGNTYPITIGTFGKVFVLINEDQARKVFLRGWSAEKDRLLHENVKDLK